MGVNWCFFDRQHSICPDPHQPPSRPAVMLLLLFSTYYSCLYFHCSFYVFDFCCILSSSPPPLPSTHRDCDLLSVHANLFTPPAVLSPPSILCLLLICNLIVVAGIIQFGCRVTGNVEDFILHALTDVTLFIARLTGFSHISIAYLWGGGK